MKFVNCITKRYLTIYEVKLRIYIYNLYIDNNIILIKMFCIMVHYTMYY